MQSKELPPEHLKSLAEDAVHAARSFVSNQCEAICYKSSKAVLDVVTTHITRLETRVQELEDFRARVTQEASQALPNGDRVVPEKCSRSLWGRILEYCYGADYAASKK